MQTRRILVSATLSAATVAMGIGSVPAQAAVAPSGTSSSTSSAISDGDATAQKVTVRRNGKVEMVITHSGRKVIRVTVQVPGRGAGKVKFSYRATNAKGKYVGPRRKETRNCDPGGVRPCAAFFKGINYKYPKGVVLAGAAEYNGKYIGIPTYYVK
ncbi:hypothetical protein [Actinomadura sp. 6N118]|uniref:hypothetical protein n=1 Tax=Actinomadura sp. 6N118 TaxID=3375151 RepID=UPI0037A2F3B4